MKQMKESKEVYEFREDEMYYWYEEKNQNITIESTISYDQVKTVYLARGHHLFPNQPSSMKVKIFPILVMEYEQDGELYYIGRGMDPVKMAKVLNLIPVTIPLKAIEFDLTHTPMLFMPEIVRTSKLIPVPREGMVELPFPVHGSFPSSPPVWEPNHVKKKKQKREDRSRWIRDGAVGIAVTVLFFIVLFIMPNWEILEDGTFDEDGIIHLSYGIVILLLVFLRHFIIHKDMYPIWKVFIYVGLIGGTFVIGGLLATILMETPEEFINAIVTEAFLSIIVIGVAYVVHLFVFFIWFFLFLAGVVGKGD
ncbi:hypothetical protein [Gracilibacillus lacisalsi]|uniref:hypothetical protein n=1 Tax=Gracilibacillus lacisalsi TaxID=393087 RepID=UPI0003636A07|nr:hypothetical protein [Gracilibacillus lacisalsi]